MPDKDAQLVQRQAFAGMIWSKQYYRYDVRDGWQATRSTQAASSANEGATKKWLHLNNANVISMPDKWEYPWYAAWDTAFDCLPLAMIDPEFAKDELVLMTREWVHASRR